MIANSWGVELLEFNRCHGPSDGRFCSLPDVTMHNEVTDAYSGQVNGSVVARGTEGAVIGKLDWTSFRGTTSINMITVAPTARRKGVALEMLRRLHQDQPDEPIKPAGTYLTGEGRAFWRIARPLVKRWARHS